MKTKLLSIAVLVLGMIAYTSIALGQDLIIKRNGDTLKVTITRSTPDQVDFTYPNETAVNTEYKNALAKIIYSSGRTEDCAGARKLAVVTGEKDWEKVELTTNPDDVKGLINLGEVSAKSGWGGEFGQGIGDKEVRKKLKKAAAKLGASIVLIQDRPVSGYYGAKLVGIAYK